MLMVQRLSLQSLMEQMLKRYGISMEIVLHWLHTQNGYQFYNMATLSTTGKNVTISGHTTHTFPMPYNIKPSDASAWYISNNDNDYDLNRASIIEGSNFYIEKVTSLPITFKGEYASFYSPVDLTIPDNANLKVYTGTMNGNKSYLPCCRR